MSYSELVQRYFAKPAFVGILDIQARDVGFTRVHSKETGRTVELFIQIDAKERIIQARFKAQGCVATIAAMAYVADFLHEKTIDQALACKAAIIMQELTLPKYKTHCALMAEEAIKRAVENLRSKHHN